MGQSQFLVLIQQLGQAKFCRIFGSGSVNQALTELQTAMFELEAGRPRRFCFSDFIDWWSRGNFGEEASMWPFHSCTCSATEAVSPPRLPQPSQSWPGHKHGPNVTGSCTGISKGCRRSRPGGGMRLVRWSRSQAPPWWEKIATNLQCQWTWITMDHVV